MRSSAAEREQVIDILKTAFADGRLTQDEYEDRVGLALSPLTYADLAELTSDLPAGLQGPPHLKPAGEEPPPDTRPLNKTAVASVVCAVLLPGIPLLAVLLGVIAHGQMQGRDERGRGLATAGIVVGVILGLMYITFVLRP